MSITSKAYLNVVENKGDSRLVPGAMPRVIAVVPAYNEKANLTALLAELDSLTIPGCDFDYVIVDDGSCDGTRKFVQDQKSNIISLPYNMGIGITVQTGFRYALAHGADYVVQVDGDCQHIPGEIEKLLKPVRDGRADMVIGSRFKSPENEGIKTTTFARWFAGRILSLNIRVLTGMRISDTTSGFRLYNRMAAELVCESYPDDYPEVQILVPLFMRSARVLEVPVLMRARTKGKSSINWHRSVYYIFKVMLSTSLDRIRGRK